MDRVGGWRTHFGGRSNRCYPNTGSRHEAADRGGTVQAVTAWRWDGIESGAGVATDVRLSWTGAVALAATVLFYVGLVHPLAGTPFGEIFGERIQPVAA